jgi:hypothetical protein
MYVKRCLHQLSKLNSCTAVCTKRCNSCNFVHLYLEPAVLHRCISHGRCFKGALTNLKLETLLILAMQTLWISLHHKLATVRCFLAHVYTSGAFLETFLDSEFFTGTHCFYTPCLVRRGTRTCLELRTATPCY